MSISVEEFQEQTETLRDLAGRVSSEAEMREVTSKIAHISRRFRVQHGIGIPDSPAQQALEVDPSYVMRPHITYLSDRIAQAVRDVERGKNRHLVISMPPRAGKSTLVSQYSPLWFLRRHPEWSIMTTAYDGALTGSWARKLRFLIEDNPALGIALKRDGGAGAQWETLEGGGMFASSVRGSLTGRGARVMIIDDPIKDFVEAHSINMRQNLWDWWLSVSQTRLEPPYLVLVVMTRWHEDDFVGRLLDPEREGDPKTWETISLPAIADSASDPLQREDGEPLYSPIMVESEQDAISRWNDVRRAVGRYTFSAMYQQRPAPARGAIFDSGWWKYWTNDPSKATEDGRVVHLDPSTLTSGKWVDSWDTNFESSEMSSGGWVVGQRWVRNNANRYLIAQQRGRWTFTQTLARMKEWAKTDDRAASPCGHLVHQRLIEKKANGAAIIDVLKDTIAGMKPINPTTSKESRARAVTPEIESGNVFLPHPTDVGNEWVNDLLSELRNFPRDVADDQVDSLTQALSGLRDAGRGSVTVPGGSGPTAYRQTRNLAAAALSDSQRRRIGGR